MAGMGADTAFGADAVNQIRAAIVQRLQQAQEMRLRDADMALRERQFQSNEELKRAQLASLESERQANTELRRQNAAHVARQGFTEEHLPGDVLQPDEAAQGRQLGVNIEHQGATLPSTQDQGVVAMPMLRGRVVMPSGAVSGEQGQASSGGATSIAQPGNPEQDIYRGNAAQREADKKERLLQGYIRKLDPNSPLGQATAYEQATGRNAPAGVFHPSLDQIGAEAEARAKAAAKYRQAPTVVVQTVDASGNPVSKIVPKTAGSEFAAKPTAQTQTRKEAATLVGSHLSTLQQEIDEADKRGLLGPALGRWAEFQAGSIGSTGNEADDMLLGKLRFDLSAVKSGFGMVHGGARGGASPELAKRWDKVLNSGKMSKAELTGALSGMQDWLGTYAKGTAPGAPPAPAGGNQEFDYVGGKLVPRAK